MDVSADLNELSRSSVGLVSAGVKSILDIGRSVLSVLSNERSLRDSKDIGVPGSNLDFIF